MLDLPQKFLHHFFGQIDQIEKNCTKSHYNSRVMFHVSVSIEACREFVGKHTKIRVIAWKNLPKLLYVLENSFCSALKIVHLLTELLRKRPCNEQGFRKKFVHYFFGQIDQIEKSCTKSHYNSRVIFHIPGVGISLVETTETFYMLYRSMKGHCWKAHKGQGACMEKSSETSLRFGKFIMQCFENSPFTYRTFEKKTL